MPLQPVDAASITKALRPEIPRMVVSTREQLCASALALIGSIPRASSIGLRSRSGFERPYIALSYLTRLTVPSTASEETSCSGDDLGENRVSDRCVRRDAADRIGDRRSPPQPNL